MNKIKSNLTMIDGGKAKTKDRIRANMHVVNDIAVYLGDNEEEILEYILLFSNIFRYLDHTTNKITKSLDNIFEESVFLKNYQEIVSKLIEIKVIIPSKDKTEYLLNPWIANGFDENNFKELMSLFPNIDISALKVIDGGKE